MRGERLLTLQRAEQLFNMYFKYLHPHLPTLDMEHSYPSAVARRNNFLFNASESVGSFFV